MSRTLGQGHSGPQQEAIASWRRGDVCVVAGPGSGKTRVLVERVRWLVESQGVDPGEILAITFTNKAAAGMKARLASAAAGSQRLRRELDRVWISTVDACCARLLRENALRAGVDPDFEIIEPFEAAIGLQTALDAALNEAFDADPSAALRFAEALHGAADGGTDRTQLTPVHGALSAAIRSFRAIGQAPFELPQPDHPCRAERRWAVHVCRRALALHQETKRAAGRLELSDLTLRAIELLRAGAPLASRFRHVLVDEQQDTNPLQERLLRALRDACKDAEPTLFAVGDPNQSIYAFRDAKPQVFRDLRDRIQQQGGHAIELLENFRSRPEILTAAALLTDGAEGVEARTLRAERGFVPKPAPSVEVMIVRSDRGRRAEAAWVAHRLVELRRSLRISVRPEAPDRPIGAREARWRDFAILGRAHDILDPFADALAQSGVPHQRGAGRGFMDAEEIRDLAGYLRLLDNPRDEIGLAAALRSPLGGLDDESILRLKASAGNLAEALARPFDGPTGQAERLIRFRRRLERFRAEREDVPPELLLARVLAETGYEAWLLAQPAAGRRLANVAKLRRLLADLDDGRRSYRNIVEALADRGAEAEASPPEDAADGVRLMTLHAAKGLEFPVVCLASVQAPGGGAAPPSLLVSAEHGLGGLWVGADGKPFADQSHAATAAANRQARAEESHRLFYVGLTRAEEHLILSAAWGTSNRSVSRKGFAARLGGLGLDLAELQAIDAAPVERRIQDLRYRLFRTAAEPPPVEIEPLETEASRIPGIEPFPAAGQADDAAAVTAVALFADCPRKYYLSRYLGLEAPAQELSAAGDAVEGTPGALGRAVHEILAGRRAAGADEAGQLAGVFLASPLGRRAAAAPHVWRERTLLFPVGERLLRGVVDLVFADDAGRVLVDYKTDNVAAEEVAERAGRYALQLQLYAVALERAGETTDRAALHFLRPDRLVDVDLSPTALARAEAIALELFAAQQNQRFELRPGAGCRRCPHFEGACPAAPPSVPGPAGPAGQLSLF